MFIRMLKICLLLKKLAMLLIFAVAISIVTIQVSYGQEDKIPDWIKTMLGYYVQGITTDAELIDTIEYLIEEDIIQIEEKKYEPFSLEKFPDTEGFNPKWLEGDKELILKNCQEAKAMGYQMGFCKYVQ